MHVCIGGRGLVNFSSARGDLTGRTTTCWRTARGEAWWGGGVQGFVICWIIRPGLRVLAGMLGLGLARSVSCKQGEGLSGSCWITKCLFPVWAGPPPATAWYLIISCWEAAGSLAAGEGEKEGGAGGEGVEKLEMLREFERKELLVVLETNCATFSPDCDVAVIVDTVPVLTEGVSIQHKAG